eukprot:6296549-Amphidinium_carterae.1
MYGDGLVGLSCASVMIDGNPCDEPSSIGLHVEAIRIDNVSYLGCSKKVRCSNYQLPFGRITLCL